jgi:hypothetical protein
MNVKCEIILDLESGEYDIRFHNLSAPGEPMDYLKIRPALARVLQDFDDRRTSDDAATADDAATPVIAGDQPSAPRRRGRR